MLVTHIYCVKHFLKVVYDYVKVKLKKYVDIESPMLRFFTDHFAANLTHINLLHFHSGLIKVTCNTFVSVQIN